MPLTPGARIGVYEITGTLGAGGMGEVYRARDTALNRQVAIKVLPEAFAHDPERLARIRREAQVLASLSHPNIAQIYGIEDNRALVLELVEGPTLADILQGQGPRPRAQANPLGMSWSDALPILRQIAAALEAAHDAGIVHRDLKPANVKVTHDGVVKVLDFGLAKAVTPDAPVASTDAMNSPTITAHATQLGMILGTAAYMAPEQARGRALDKRADVWAFGAVMYEMLAGKRAFDGEDVSEVLAAVLKTEPDWSALPADLPSSVLRLLRRCLEKDPKKRLRDIGDGMAQLDDSAPAAPGTAPHARRMWATAVAAAIAAAIASSFATTMLRRAPAAAPEIVRFDHLPGPDLRLYSTRDFPDIAISPDGRAVVYPAVPSGGRGQAPALQIRRLDDGTATPLEGGQSVTRPVFSPDGKWIVGVSSGAAIVRIPASGGAPVRLGLSRGEYGMTWTDDNLLVLGGHPGELGLHQMPAEGGDARPLTTPDAARQEFAHGWPSAIPGTRLVLFSINTGSAARAPGQLAILNRDTSAITRTEVGCTQARFLAPAHVICSTTEGTLRAVPFDVSRGAVTGSAVQLSERAVTKVTGASNFAISRNGHLALISGTVFTTARDVVWVDRKGVETPTGAPPQGYFYARVAPDGRRLTLDLRESAQDIALWDPRGSLTPITINGASQYGLWMPDNTHVVVFSIADGRGALFTTRADGTGSPRVLYQPPTTTRSPYPNAVTRDGKTLVFRSSEAGQNDIFSIPTDGTGSPVPLVTGPADELNAALSPDDKWLAFESNASKRYEVFVRPFPKADTGQWPISIDGGTEPVWSPTGREIFYLSRDGKLMAVPIETTKGFSAGRPVALFDTTPYFFGGIGRNYDVTDDGRRFVMIKELKSPTETPRPVSIVLNWGEAIRNKR